jgi:hypothetical protein
MRNLIKKGWLARLVGGRYMLLPPEYGPENRAENNPIAPPPPPNPLMSGGGQPPRFMVSRRKNPWR